MRQLDLTESNQIFYDDQVGELIKIQFVRI